MQSAISYITSLLKADGHQSIRDKASRQIGFKWCTFLITYFLVLSLLFICYYRHEIDADGTSYISLALKYLNNDFGDAVSGHWAPMISWIIALFMSFGLEPIIAFRVASILIGVMTLVGIDKLMLEIEITRYVRILYLVALCPVVVWYAENAVRPDLLCACVLLHYLYATLRDKYQNKKYYGIACGTLGALSYLAKNYNFYFILMHFICINAFFLKRASSSQKRIITVNFFSAIVVFMLLSGLWVGLLSFKYHTFTVGTAGIYNFSHIRPGHDLNNHPTSTDGFMPPPNNTAISVWEDPNYIKLVHWSPFKSIPDFLYYLKYIPKNICKYLSGLATNYIFVLAMLSPVFITLFLKNTLNTKVGYVLLTILLYPLGYFALYYDGQRYVLFNAILLYILSAYTVNFIILKYWESRILEMSISAVLVASLIALTLVRIKHDGFHLDELNDIYRVSTEIEKYYNMKGVNIASQGGTWNPALNLSFFLKARYFGKALDTETDEQLRHELIDYGIQYYLVYGFLKNSIDILKPERKFESLNGAIVIYRVKQQTAKLGLKSPLFSESSTTEEPNVGKLHVRY